MPRNREEADLFFCSVTPLQNVRNENLGHLTLRNLAVLAEERGDQTEARRL